MGMRRPCLFRQLLESPRETPWIIPNVTRSHRYPRYSFNSTSIASVILRETSSPASPAALAVEIIEHHGFAADDLDLVKMEIQ